METKRVNFAGVMVFIVLALMSVTYIFPVVFIFITSLKKRIEYYTNPFSLTVHSFDFMNYRAMISQFNLINNFKNTFIVVIFSVVLITVFAVIASFAFAKLRFKNSVPMYMFIVATMFIPGQITMIPMYVLFSKIGLVNNFLSVILVYLANGLPGAIMLMTANFRAIPGEMLESSRMDGAGYFKIIWYIVVPMGKAAIAINVVMSFIGYWNDLFTPMILLQNEDVKTIMVALASLMGRYVGDPPYQMAGIMLAMVPAILVYVLFQRFIVKGLVVGSIK